MQWWAWIAIGVLLLGTELAFVDAQFYLLFIGTAALFMGALAVSGVMLPEWQQWAVFIALSVISLAVFRRRIYARIRPQLPQVKDGYTGEWLTVPVMLAPGEECRVEFRGSTWNAMNGDAHALAAGSTARIERVQGMTLVLRA